MDKSGKGKCQICHQELDQMSLEVHFDTFHQTTQSLWSSKLFWTQRSSVATEASEYFCTDFFRESFAN